MYGSMGNKFFSVPYTIKIICMHMCWSCMLLTITLSAIHLSVSNVTFVSFNILKC